VSCDRSGFEDLSNMLVDSAPRRVEGFVHPLRMRNPSELVFDF